MADLTMSVQVSRDLLGLGPLEINDFVSYYVTPQFMGAARAWSRTQVGSPWLNGQRTTNRTLEMVVETVVVDYLGGSAAEAQQALVDITQAFDQDGFTMTITISGVTNTYQCESSDFTVLWDGPHWIAQHGQITFSMPRQPIPIVGV